MTACAWRLHGFESTDALFGVSGKALGKVPVSDWLMLLMRVMIMEYNNLLFRNRYRLQWGLVLSAPIRPDLVAQAKWAQRLILGKAQDSAQLRPAQGRLLWRATAGAELTACKMHREGYSRATKHATFERRERRGRGAAQRQGARLALRGRACACAKIGLVGQGVHVVFPMALKGEAPLEQGRRTPSLRLVAQELE